MRPYSSQWPHMYLFVAAFHVSPQNFMQGTWYFIEAGKKLYSFSLHCVFLNGIFLKIFFNFIYVVSSYARVRSELLGVISGMLGVTLCFHTGHHVAALGSAALRQSWRASSSGPQEKQPFSPPLRFEWGIFFFFFFTERPGSCWERRVRRDSYKIARDRQISVALHGGQGPLEWSTRLPAGGRERGPHGRHVWSTENEREFKRSKRNKKIMSEREKRDYRRAYAEGRCRFKKIHTSAGQRRRDEEREKAGGEKVMDGN